MSQVKGKVNNFLDISVICRLCGENSVKKKYVFLKNNQELLDKIFSVLGLEISFPCTTSTLPRHICEKCADLIQSFYYFKENCIKFIEDWENFSSDHHPCESDDAPKVDFVDDTDVQALKCNFMILEKDLIIEPVVEWISMEDNEEDELPSMEEIWIEGDDLERQEINEEEIESESLKKDELKLTEVYEEEKLVPQTPCDSSDPILDRLESESPETNVFVNRNGLVYQSTAYKYVKVLGKNEFACKFCNKTFRWKSKVWLHIRQHTKETPFQCDKCDKSFAAAHYLNTHKRQKHKGKEYVCKICDKIFIRKYLYTEHLNSHHGPPTLKCEYCDKRFYGNTKLTAHLNNFHVAKNFMCDICGKTFKTKPRINEHMLRHTTERNNCCDLCNYKCVTQIDLRRHMERHKHDYQFKCVKCRLSFKSKKGMDLHENSCSTKTV